MHPDSESVLRHMLKDDDWRVRAQAARGLGALGAAAAIPELSEALLDRAWWVRFRAALALAQLGEAGRRALRAARERVDRYAAEMASMVSGLSDGAVVELAEA
jgi:HEAT repeat protein